VFAGSGHGLPKLTAHNCTPPSRGFSGEVRLRHPAALPDELGGERADRLVVEHRPHVGIVHQGPDIVGDRELGLTEPRRMARS
jgi:hypothetical protein